MYKLLYFHNKTLKESYIFPSEALANWKARELYRLGTHVYGHFVIQKI